MKFFKRILLAAAFSTLLLSRPVYAGIGDMGFFGGISIGERLPTTTELMILQDTSGSSSRTSARATPMTYKEIVMLDGIPYEFEGTITVKSGTMDTKKNFGQYTYNVVIQPSNVTGDTSIARNITFMVSWRKEGQQLIKDYKSNTWSETITTPMGTYIIDTRQSNYNISIIEDHQPGVTYYKGNTSGHSVYTNGAFGPNSYKTVLDVSDSFYGYNCAWSRTETHRMDASVINEDWQLQYQIRPSVSSNKIMQYTQNEPQAISFPGNYREVLQITSGLQYNIFVKPDLFYYLPDEGFSNIIVPNQFEQLISPDLNYLKGHPAEDDIRRLFSMQILEGDPKYYQPAQAITRGQYTNAIMKATKIPIDITLSSSASRATPSPSPRPRPNAQRSDEVVTIVFPDVTPDRPDYNIIMSAFKSGITIGRDNGRFYSDSTLDRQEAVAIILRALGLENLELDPTPITAFADDYKISSWARKELYAAMRLGIIGPDEDGNIRPNDIVSKAEAAALINRLIDYMRNDLAIDYEYIVNYAN